MMDALLFSLSVGGGVSAIASAHFETKKAAGSAGANK